VEYSTEDLHCGKIQATNPMKSVAGRKNRFLGVSVLSKRSTFENCGREFPACTVTYGKLYVCYRCHVQICKTN